MRKIYLIPGIITGAAVLLVVGSMAAGGMIFDRKIDQVLQKVEQRVPGLSLAYEPRSSSIFSRVGVISWRLALPEKNALGLPYLSGSSHMELSFGPLRADAVFSPVSGAGNIADLFARFNLKPIRYQADLKVKALLPQLSFILKSASFELPLEFGSCSVGENTAEFTASSPDDMQARLNVSAVKCRGSELYAGRESFLIDLSDLSLSAAPRYAQGQVTAENISAAVGQLTADFSTLFAIGFAPDAEVRDSTMRDAVELDNLKAVVSFTDNDERGMAVMNFAGSGNFAAAFPAVAGGQAQPFYRLEQLDLKGQAGRLDIKRLFRALPHLTADGGLSEAFAAFSDEQSFRLDNFSFVHEGESVQASGQASAAFDFESLRVQNMQADFTLQGGVNFVNDLAGADYAVPLSELCRGGQVDFDGSIYRTHLTIHEHDIRLNGLPLHLKNEDEVPEEYEELPEQGALPPGY